MARLYLAIVINTLFYATLAAERPFNNVQYIRSKILDNKFFLNCKLSASDRIFKIFAPSNRLYGYCYKTSAESKWSCFGNIIQHVGSNTMTVEVNIRISKETCGEWKCIHGRKQDTVNIKSTEKSCNILRDVDRIPDFKGVVWLYDRLKTFFKFSCIIFQRLIGNTVMFLVNYKTVDILRFYNNTCYNKNRACSGGTDICGCFYTGNVFTMKYEIEKTGSVYVNTMFGVQMILKENNGNVVQMTLLRIYDGKDFGNLKTITDTVLNVHAVIPKVETVKKDVHNGPGINTFLLVIFLTAVIICTFRKCTQCRGAFRKCTQCRGSEAMKTNTKDTKCL